MPINNWFYLRKDTTIKVDTITSPSDTYVPIAAVDSPPTCNIISVENLKDSVTGYKKFVGLLSQFGASAPTINVEMENNLGTASTSYISTGSYKLTFDDLAGVPYGQVAVFISNGTGISNAGIIEAWYDGNDYVLIKSYDAAGTLSNAKLNQATIEVRIYS